MCNANRNNYHHNHHHHHQGQRRGTFCALMLTASILVLLLCIAPKLTAAQSLSSIAQKLKLPESIPITSSTPIVRVQVSGNAVKPGDVISAKVLKGLDINKVDWDADYSGKYILMLLDLDRPKPDSNTTMIYNQYTNLNIPGNHVSSGQVITAFDSPSIPCQPPTKHRLVLLVLQQDQTIDLTDIAYISSPVGYSTRRDLSKFEDFTSRHRLHVAAANVFQAIGEVNGVCSAATTVHPSILSLSSIIIVMVMFQWVLLRQH